MHASASASGLHAAMAFHHARLETLGRHALSTLRLSGPAAARPSFEAFKRELDAHLEAEETWILPPFRQDKPADCKRLRSDHTELRCLADAVERALEAGARDEEPLRSLVERLAAHSREEENDCYAWAESRIDERASRAVIQRIETAELEAEPMQSSTNVKT